MIALKDSTLNGIGLISSNYYFFECTLEDTLTAKMVTFRGQHPK